MKLHQKFKTCASVLTLVLLGAGCGGISGSHSVSPASFFLPGLLEAQPKPKSTEAVPTPQPPRQLAQVR